MRTRLLLLALLLSFGLAHGDESEQVTATVLQRALHAMGSGAGIKSGFMLEKHRAGRTTRFIEAVLAAPDDELERIQARIFAKYIERADAEFLLAFYTSPTGRRLTSDQALDPINPTPMLSLNPAQLREAQVFSASAPLQRYRRVSESKATLDEIGAALRATFLQ